jgi:hypothetical protein
MQSPALRLRGSGEPKLRTVDASPSGLAFDALRAKRTESEAMGRARSVRTYETEA